MGRRRLVGGAVGVTTVEPPTVTRPGSMGIMGGTFDPVHLGHLAVAEEAREVLGLERVLFVPAGVPPHKLDGAAAGGQDRMAMVRLAITGNPAFEASRIDLDRPGPSFTADTVALLSAAVRERGGMPDLTLIMSTETLAGLPAWRDPDRLLRACRIAVVPREDQPLPDAAWLDEPLPRSRGPLRPPRWTAPGDLVHRDPRPRLGRALHPLSRPRRGRAPHPRSWALHRPSAGQPHLRFLASDRSRAPGDHANAPDR